MPKGVEGDNQALAAKNKQCTPASSVGACAQKEGVSASDGCIGCKTASMGDGKLAGAEQKTKMAPGRRPIGAEPPKMRLKAGSAGT